MRIRAKGFLIDSLDSLLEQPILDDKFKISFPKEWKGRLFEVKDGRLQINDPNFETLWRTLVGDRYYRLKVVLNAGFDDHRQEDIRLHVLRSKAPQEWKGDCMKLLENDAVSFPYGSSDFVAKMRSLLVDKQFNITAKKALALVPRDARVDDIVCILLGCSVPVVLRPVEQASDNGGHLENEDEYHGEHIRDREYYFVGEAYVHGIMDGEAMEWLAAKHFELEEFCIA
jgi:hypothetical protein